MAVPSIVDIVDSAKKLILGQGLCRAPHYRERQFVSVEGLLYEDHDRTGHGKAGAVEKLFRAALGFVIDSEVYLSHGIVSPLRRELYHKCVYDVKCPLYDSRALTKLRGTDPIGGVPHRR